IFKNALEVQMNPRYYLEYSSSFNWSPSMIYCLANGILKSYSCCSCLLTVMFLQAKLMASKRSSHMAFPKNSPEYKSLSNSIW
ncbi:MAG TPA: hypothetical protein VI146_06655, partial [Nitrososphaeraceae archaeon]